MSSADRLPETADEHGEDLAFVEVHGGLDWERELRRLVLKGERKQAWARVVELERDGNTSPALQRWRQLLMPTQVRVGAVGTGATREAARQELKRRTEEFRGHWVLLSAEGIVDSSPSRTELLARHRGPLGGFELEYVSKEV